MDGFFGRGSEGGRTVSGNAHEAVKRVRDDTNFLVLNNKEGQCRGLDPVRALYFAAILNGLAAPPLILLMLLLSRARDICGDLAGGRLSTALVVVALVLMTALPLIYLLVR